MRRNGWLLGLVLLAAGCSDGGGTLAAKTPSGPVVKELSLTGPGGVVQLGDPVDQAKNAFPAPSGARVMTSSMSFAMVAPEGWAWALETSNPEAFEAATKEGKIVALGRTMAVDDGQLAKQVADLGEPTRKAEGSNANAYVWESGDKARFLIEMKKTIEMMPFKTLLIIGGKEDLKQLNYQADDPSLAIKQLDAALEQFNSPEMRKAFEDAKKKAKAKAQGKGA